MRQIAISVLSLFIVLPAFADVRLPVVNITAGGVSARAAFGEPVVKQTEKVVANNPTNGENKEKIANAETNNRGVVSRNTISKPVQIDALADAGEQIIASDILSPRRPSSDLWTSSSSNIMPLRLPTPQEFSVIRSDSALPEESLDGDISQQFAYDSGIKEVVKEKEPLSELDSQIARLNELQRLADESVQKSLASNEKEQSSRVVSRNTVTRQTSETTKSSPDNEVKLVRMVVPMDDSGDDVIVRAVQRAESPQIISTRNEMTQMSPTELRKAFRKTFLSENKHLSTFQIDNRFDVASDMTVNAEGFTSERDLSETGGIRPLEIKIKFRNDDAALSRDNYNLLTEYAGIVLSNPTRAVQVSIPQTVTTNADDRKLAARRLAIIEQVLRDNGISEQRILPVLSQRDEEGLVLRMISLDQYETLTKQQRDVFGDTVSKKTYRSMSW